MVDRFSPLRQWKRHNSPTCRHNDFLQFLKNRMGCPPRFNPDRGKMVNKETSSHINFLELKAAFLAFQALVPSVKGLHICFGIDSHTAMSHINKLGDTRFQKLSNLAIELWNCALNRNLLISAIHIPGKLNVADHKSRSFKDSIEWMANPRIFRGVVATLGQPGRDLFASKVIHQILEFVSWRPEPNAVATDAFNLTWNYHFSYLFPPFSLIPLCLKKIQRSSRMHFHHTSLEKQTMVSNSLVNLVTPAFTVTSVPISSSAPRNEQDSHLLYPKVFQTSCMEGSRQTDFKVKDLLRRCLTFSSPHGEKALQGNIRVLGDRGVAGVTLGRLIVFQHLSKTS